MPLLPKSSYYDNRQRQGASLLRARQPYLVKNMVTGLALLAFTGSIYAYTIKAVGVDDFGDVKPATSQTPNASVVQPAQNS